jgi:hypothetical protein
MLGIDNQPYIDIEQYIPQYMNIFDTLQPEIMSGFATARHYAKEGTWMKPGFTFTDMSYRIHWKPIYEAFDEFMRLPDDNTIKIGGMKLMPTDFKNFQQRNIFTRYLKMSMGAYDPYIYYYLWEEGSWDDRSAPRKLTTEAQHFPDTVKWVESMVGDMFESIGRVIFFHCEHDGIPFEHRDLDAKNGIDTITPHNNEFIHFRPNTKKPFYVWDPASSNKYYINARAAFWNDNDWHGGDRILQQSYSLRVDGKFTEEFRRRIKINHLESY